MAESGIRARFDQLAAPVRRGWGKLPLAGRVAVGLAAVGFLAVAVWMVAASGPGPMEPLYDHPVELAEAAQIREQLERTGVPYSISRDGNIRVPSDRKLEIRMELASEGVQPTTTVGFELFDEQRFGASDFEQRVNFRRALEGELARTIQTLRSVEATRVHLSIPRRSLFRAEELEPSASVVVKLRRGAVLGNKQVVGIQELVARSVERLTPERVAVLDETGDVLSRDAEDSSGSMALDQRRNYERRIEGQVEDILERAIGEGHAVVRVAAEFDFTRTEEMQERYDPDRSVIRSEQRTEERTGGEADQAGGIPGVRSNLPGGPPPTKGMSAEASVRESETKNYEVDKVVRRVSTPVARLERQSVAVLVDGIWNTSENGERTYVERSPEELERIASLVKRAVGFDADRGDSVEVQNMQFVADEDGLESGAGAPGTSAWPSWLTYVVAGLAALLIAGVFAMAMRRRSGQKEEPAALPLTVKQLEAELAGTPAGERLGLPSPAGAERAAGDAAALPGRAETREEEEIRHQAVSLASQDTVAAARVLRSWIHERPNHREAKEA